LEFGVETTTNHKPQTTNISKELRVAKIGIDPFATKNFPLIKLFG
jgi:hypothetical protein